MQNIIHIPESFFSLVRKAFTFDKGSLVVIATPFTFVVKAITEPAVFQKVKVQQAFYEIFDAETIKSLLFVLLAFGVLTTLYTLVSAIDFYTGLSASKKEHVISAGSAKGYIKSDKLWSSVWKFFGVIVIGSIAAVFTMLFILTDLTWLYDVFMLALILFYFVVIAFDIHSIGENHLRRYGKKPAFYSFMDEISELVKTQLIERIKRKFN